MYNSSLKHWFEFVDQRDTIAGNYLLEGCELEVTTQFACIFAAYCSEKHYAVDSSFSAMRDYFISNMKMVDFIDNNVMVQSVRAAIKKKILNAKKEQSSNISSSFR